MNREEVREEIEAKQRKTIGNACRLVEHAPTASEARDQCVRMILSLSGVSGDPVTSSMVVRLVDTLAARLSVPDRQDGADRCWIQGVHRPHEWVDLGTTFGCPGRVSTS